MKNVTKNIVKVFFPALFAFLLVAEFFPALAESSKNSFADFLTKQHLETSISSSRFFF